MAVCHGWRIFMWIRTFRTGFYNIVGREGDAGRMADCVDNNAVQHDTVGPDGVHKHFERLRQTVGSLADIAGDDDCPYYFHDIFDKSDGAVGCAGGDGDLVCIRLCCFDERVLCESDSFGGKADVLIHF